MKQSGDVLQLVIADAHSGSNHALFVDRFWQGMHTNHTPTSEQVGIREQFVKFCDEVAEMRKGKRVRLVHDGDAIDGDHHHSGDVCSLYENEQVEVHIELMNELQKRIKWQAGDELYYVKGTDIHVRGNEETIGRELNAVQDGDNYSWSFLELETNGKLSWFVHAGPQAGKGANEGNGMRNWLRDICYDALKDGRRVPDILYTAHVHTPSYTSYVWREEMEFRVMHGIICPSWQAKTTYAYAKAPVQRNKIGGVIHLIHANGDIAIPKFSVK